MQGIKNGYMLPETLKDYSSVTNSIDPPLNTVVYNQAEWWYCERNSKLYRACKNDGDNIVVWFED